MADSSITKKALANALKELMKEMPFEKIRVANICERCGMNRKSFYYHFKDKYDLLNWIFDSEFSTVARGKYPDDSFDQWINGLLNECQYFYENRDFYRKALKLEGQNSFSEHFREYVVPAFHNRLVSILGSDVDEFDLNFYIDAAICAIERWILDENCMPPEVFVEKLLRIVLHNSGKIHHYAMSKVKSVR